MAEQGLEPPGNKSAARPDDQVDSAFERFVEEHYQAAYRFAFSLCGNHSDACDVTQQAFYLAQTRQHQLHDDAKRKPWLFTILYREFLRTRRRESAHPHVSLEFSESLLPPISVDHASQLDGQTVLRALQTLDENFRAPLALFYLDQLSYKEIAAALAVPIGTVMSRLARGKAMLRARLEEKRGEKIGKIVPLHQPNLERGITGG